ncbi:MAG: hypothetical protein NTV81_03960, partial [Candidatus Komeilibacteria bacterium]|nr:hypothetical protein [Candidatus Komeilibacteria bacterium]
LSHLLEEFIRANSIGQKLARVCISVGVPILLPDGTLLRGPRVNIPETTGHIHEFPVDADNVNQWAETGWVDLRVSSMTRWIERINRIQRTTGDHGAKIGNGSDEALGDFARSFKPGEVVAFIFADEFDGARIK